MYTFRHLAILSVIFLSAQLFSSDANAWWNQDWQYRKEITLNTPALTGDLSQDVADITIPLRLHVGNFNYFFDVNGDGSDIRIIDEDDKTPLKFHIEKFDILDEMAIIWVRIPLIQRDDDQRTFYMYYGNQDAVRGSKPEDVFDPNLVAVYHFGQRTGKIRDYTAFANDAERDGGEPTPGALLGCGVKFSKTGRIILPEHRQMPFGGNTVTTISLWMKPAASESPMTLLGRSDGKHHFSIELESEKIKAVIRDADGIAILESSPEIRYISDNWHHLAITVSREELTLYINGEAKASIQAPIAAISAPWSIGSESGNLDATIDEVRVSNVLRNISDIRANSLLEAPHTELLYYGDDVERPSDGFDTTYIEQTMGSVDISGWVVIALLMILGVVSAIAFIVKLFALIIIRSENRRFTTFYESLNNQDLISLVIEPAQLAKQQRETSTFDSILRAALIELKDISDETSDETVNIDENVLVSLRSAMNIALIAEVQRLKKRLIVMTIAISGAPFLGLLGTVIGVTLTFAVIAATGDVNISSIAPGMASALTTTIIGLSVAIPNLFAYNFVSLKAQDIAHETRAFSDRISARFSRLGHFNKG